MDNWHQTFRFRHTIWCKMKAFRQTCAVNLGLFLSQTLPQIGIQWISFSFNGCCHCCVRVSSYFFTILESGLKFCLCCWMPGETFEFQTVILTLHALGCAGFDVQAVFTRRKPIFVVILWVSSQQIVFWRDQWTDRCPFSPFRLHATFVDCHASAGHVTCFRPIGRLKFQESHHVTQYYLHNITCSSGPCAFACILI